ncbi:ABC transporter substrate-binding protein [Prosthecodimorpha staleyi]|uniref:ABC transporter substrate-binding protein n=1 Tax=Prosthecodimorpha staleyi TaxID=2840188 RepID=A0A947CZG4_9HYPH|nr:ABC transporter substrate-binding protein [Prosthecodimorpha staleyi]MBT9287965.1 ABC transporter substrate-binding protein [Prosthecodimorpha staleyi]
MTWLVRFATLYFTAMFTFATQAADDLKVGLIAPLSGPLSIIGTEVVQASKLKIAMLNAGGGIDGRKISLIEIDSSCTPGKILRNEYLIADLDFAVEYNCGVNIMASLDVFQRHNVPHLVYELSERFAPEIYSGVGIFAKPELVKLFKVERMLKENSQDITKHAILGYSSLEIFEQAMRISKSYKRQDVLNVIKFKEFQTSAGEIKFNTHQNPVSSSFLMDIWQKEDDCPKCPKAGMCPQAIAAMIIEKKVCNKTK